MTNDTVGGTIALWVTLVSFATAICLTVRWALKRDAMDKLADSYERIKDDHTRED